MFLNDKYMMRAGAGSGRFIFLTLMTDEDEKGEIDRMAIFVYPISPYCSAMHD
ncbi:hypothetical protein [Novosphingobium sp. 63-713]|uniref:hypothetical protein n=1 Tax=Novosphingobium sp. 63-713 TaxID=1895900 RepID=UPI0025D3B8E6|nr:hypothetical protein [Novosphingobium sp. 63-713]